MLDRLFGRRTADDRHHTQPDASDASSPAGGAGSPECTHLAMTPRWDRIEDMGHEDRATAWVCDSCHMSLTPEEAERARVTAADRLRTNAE